MTDAVTLPRPDILFVETTDKPGSFSVFLKNCPYTGADRRLLGLLEYDLIIGRWVYSSLTPGTPQVKLPQRRRSPHEQRKAQTMVKHMLGWIASRKENP